MDRENNYWYVCMHVCMELSEGEGGNKERKERKEEKEKEKEGGKNGSSTVDFSLFFFLA